MGCHKKLRDHRFKRQFHQERRGKRYRRTIKENKYKNYYCQWRDSGAPVQHLRAFTDRHRNHQIAFDESGECGVEVGETL